VRECNQWSKGRGRLVGGREGVPAKLGSVLVANPQTPSREEGEELLEIRGVSGTDAKASYGNRRGVPAKLGVPAVFPVRNPLLF